VPDQQGGKPVSNKRVSEMTDEEIREMAGASTRPAASDPGWPATRRSIDTAIERARREIKLTVENTLYDLGTVGKRKAEAILASVQDALDDIDQTIPPEEDQ
jgi:hypothetical protein